MQKVRFILLGLCLALVLCLVLTLSLNARQDPSAITFEIDLLHNKTLQQYNGETSSQPAPHKKLLLRRETESGSFYSVCDTHTGKEIARIEKNDLQLLEVSNDERRSVFLYTSPEEMKKGKDRMFRDRIGLFDLDTGKEINSWQGIRLGPPSTTPFQGYFSPNSKYFLILTGTRPNPTALVIESETGKISQEYKLGYFRPIAISKNHRFVAFATPQRQTLYLDLNLNQTKYLPYYPIVISDDGNYILAVDEKGKEPFHVFLDARTGEIVQTFHDLETGMCSHISVASDCKTLWNDSKMWSIESGKLLAHVERRSPAFYSSDSKFLYLNKGLLLETATGNLIWSLDERQDAISFSDPSLSILLEDGTLMSTAGDRVLARIGTPLQYNDRIRYNECKSRKGILRSVAGQLEYVDLRDGKVLFSMKESDFLPSQSYEADSYVMPEGPQKIFVTYQRKKR